MLDLLASPVGHLLAFIHSALSTFLIPSSGPAWAFSIVLLTVVVRLLLFPLFVKQIKSQRRMQELAPRVQELKKLHKGDRETMNTEMMKLYKANNANPISGCLPLLVQLPVFFALFSVIREFKPGADPKYGLSSQLLEEGGRAKVFGAPISAAFNSSADMLSQLEGNATTVRIIAFIMVIGMGATTFYTQKQMIARATVTDPQQIMIQKLMLYVLPFSFLFSGFFFPIGVLLYWLTTNIWSMGQQAYVIKRMPPVDLTGGAKTAAGGAKPVAGAKAAKPVAGASSGGASDADAPKKTGVMASLREAALAKQAAAVEARAAAAARNGTGGASALNGGASNGSGSNGSGSHGGAPSARPATAGTSPQLTSATRAGSAKPDGGAGGAALRTSVGTSTRRASGSRKNKRRKGGR